MDAEDLKERVNVMILAGALGDALGAPHEFIYQKKDYDGNLNKRIHYRPNRWQLPKASAIGQTTDDTEMTLCLWRSLVQNLSYDKITTIKHYLEWANDPGTWAMGRNTRALFKGVKTVKGYASRFSKLPNNESEVSQSNGSLMRCSPLALYGVLFPDEWRNAVQIDNDLTNPNPTNRWVNKIYVKALIMALKGKSKKAIKRAVKNQIDRSESAIIRQRFNIICIGTPLVIKKFLKERSTKGWCVNGLTAALWGLFNFDNYKDAIDEIIKAEGDTDTNACIAGCLLGAYYGNDWKKDKQTQANLEVMLNCDTSKGNMPRDQIYTIDSYKEFWSILENWIDSNID